MEVLLYIDLWSTDQLANLTHQVAYKRDILDEAKALSPELVVFDLDNFSEGFFVEQILQLMAEANKLCLIWHPHAPARLGGVRRIAEQYLRLAKPQGLRWLVRGDAPPQLQVFGDALPEANKLLIPDTTEGYAQLRQAIGQWLSAA